MKQMFNQTRRQKEEAADKSQTFICRLFTLLIRKNNIFQNKKK